MVWEYPTPRRKEATLSGLLQAAEVPQNEAAQLLHLKQGMGFVGPALSFSE